MSLLRTMQLNYGDPTYSKRQFRRPLTLVRRYFCILFDVPGSLKYLSMNQHLAVPRNYSTAVNQRLIYSTACTALAPGGAGVAYMLHAII